MFNTEINFLKESYDFSSQTKEILIFKLM